MFAELSLHHHSDERKDEKKLPALAAELVSLRPDVVYTAEIKACLEGEGIIAEAGLTPEELQLLEAHAFLTGKPIAVAEPPNVSAFDDFLVGVVRSAGYISFLTVGGPENRAWLIRKGATAQGRWCNSHRHSEGIHPGRNHRLGRLHCRRRRDAGENKKDAPRDETYVMQDYDLANFRFKK